MKKLISLILSVFLLLALVACGGGDDSDTSGKEALLETAQELSFGEIYEAYTEDAVRAVETYVGKPYLIFDYVSAVAEDHARIGSFSVYLSGQELAQLNSGEKVTVVGVLASIDGSETDISINGVTGTQFSFNGIVKDAYYVGNSFDISGMVYMGYLPEEQADGTTDARIGDPNAWYCGILAEDNAFYSFEGDEATEHVPGEQVSSVLLDGQSVESGDSVSISATFRMGQTQDGRPETVILSGQSYSNSTLLTNITLLAMFPGAGVPTANAADVQQALQGSWRSPQGDMIWVFEGDQLSYSRLLPDGLRDAGTLPYTITETAIVFNYAGGAETTELDYAFADGVLTLYGTASQEDGGGQYEYIKQ